MENRDTELTDQTDDLKKLVNDVNGETDQTNKQEQTGMQEQKTQKQTFAENEKGDIVDILDLPPRRDVHQKSQHTTFKISRASVRLLVVVIILVLVFGTAFYLWGEDLWSSILNI